MGSRPEHDATGLSPSQPSNLPRFELSSALVDLIDPGLFDIRFIALFQTVDQRGHQASALADGKLHRLLEQLFRFICHAPSMPDLVGCCYRRFSGDQARLERKNDPAVVAPTPRTLSGLRCSFVKWRPPAIGGGSARASVSSA